MEGQENITLKMLYYSLIKKWFSSKYNTSSSDQICNKIVGKSYASDSLMLNNFLK